MRKKRKLSATEFEAKKLIPKKSEEPEEFWAKSWEYDKVEAAPRWGDELPRNAFHETHLQRLLRLRGENLGEPLPRQRKRISKYGY